jgi:hypothetical protein
VFPAKYKHHLYKKGSYPRNRPWRCIGVFSTRYEHHLHIVTYTTAVWRVTNNSTWIWIGYRIYSLWRFITATGYSY